MPSGLSAQGDRRRAIGRWVTLATALSISGELGALITYDNRMISDGQAIGLPVVSPA